MTPARASRSTPCQHTAKHCAPNTMLDADASFTIASRSASTLASCLHRAARLRRPRQQQASVDAGGGGGGWVCGCAYGMGTECDASRRRTADPGLGGAPLGRDGGSRSWLLGRLAGAKHSCPLYDTSGPACICSASVTTMTFRWTSNTEDVLRSCYQPVMHQPLTFRFYHHDIKMDVKNGR